MKQEEWMTKFLYSEKKGITLKIISELLKEAKFDVIVYWYQSSKMFWYRGWYKLR